jgi:IS30 family transposase
MQRCRMSGAERAELWTRRQRGETYRVIARALDRTARGIHDVIQATGGVPPALRRRAAWTVSLEEREEISRGLAAGLTLAAIARHLQRPTSTISREVRRHGGRGQYRSARADGRAWRRARRPKPCRLVTHARLRAVVAAKLACQWSPRQIAGWLRAEYPDNPEMHVSHETIYLSLFVQARGALKHTLVKQLRRPRSVRRPRGRPQHNPERIPGAVSIRERPASVEDRAIPGHWEGDLLRGKGRSHIATLVERHSRYVMLVRIPRADSATVARALARRIRTLPAHLRKSLTWDRGREMAQHHRFTVATNVRVYFCDPRSPWQRGSNENTNGLLRQYFPAGTDLAPVTQRQLNAVAHRLNTRPRETLGFKTPAATLAACVAPTA